jgi:hypothetical protein
MGWLNSVGGLFKDVVHAAGDGYKAATNGHLWDTALNGAKAGAENAQIGSWIDSRAQYVEHKVDQGRA